MGLFSSKEEKPIPKARAYNKPSGYSSDDKNYGQTQHARNITELLRIYQEEELQRLKQEQELIYLFQKLSISKSDDTSAYSFQPTSVTVNSNLLCELLRNENYTTLNGNNVYNLITLDEHSTEYLEIKNMFTGTNKRFFKVNNIMKIYNPYLLAQYKLMEKCYRKRYGFTTTKQLFHGTKIENVDNICRYNFNWRLKGTARGHIFGQGVSFTPISNYATHYGDTTFQKVMIVANVLISNKCVGAPNTIIPPSNYDTTTKENEHVFVKYEDNTFYPAYIIYYEGVDTSKGKKWDILYLYSNILYAMLI